MFLLHIDFNLIFIVRIKCLIHIFETNVLINDSQCFSSYMKKGTSFFFVSKNWKKYIETERKKINFLRNFFKNLLLRQKCMMRNIFSCIIGKNILKDEKRDVWTRRTAKSLEKFLPLAAWIENLNIYIGFFSFLL